MKVRNLDLERNTSTLYNTIWKQVMPRMDNLHLNQPKALRSEQIKKTWKINSFVVVDMGEVSSLIEGRQKERRRHTQ